MTRPAPRRVILKTDDLKDALAEIVAEGGSVEYAGRALELGADVTLDIWNSIMFDLGLDQCV